MQIFRLPDRREWPICLEEVDLELDIELSMDEVDWGQVQLLWALRDILVELTGKFRFLRES